MPARRQNQSVFNKRSAAVAAVAGLVLAAFVLGRVGFLSSQRVHTADNRTTEQDAPDRTVPRPRLELPPPAELLEGYAVVERVVDGDTLIVNVDGKPERTRLIGIDCPEVGRERVAPSTPGWIAAMFVFDLLHNNAQVRLEFDAGRTDRFGRTLAYAHLPDGRMLNEVLLEHGWAKVMRIPPNTRHARRFAEIERQAREERRGMWAGQ